MENVLGRLYVGGDKDYESIKDKLDWSVLRCAKYGPGGHQDTIGYRTLAAPKGPDYLAVKKGDRMALNFIDANDPNLIPAKMVETGLQYIDQRINAGDKVLVACNSGRSRGPTTAMLYLRAIGELPGNFISSERIFRTLYHKYDPGIGMRTFARNRWSYFDNFLRKS